MFAENFICPFLALFMPILVKYVFLKGLVAVAGGNLKTLGIKREICNVIMGLCGYRSDSQYQLPL